MVCILRRGPCNGWDWIIRRHALLARVGYGHCMQQLAWLNCTYTVNTARMLWLRPRHYDDVIMGAMASQITSLTSVYSIFYSDTDQRKHQSSASLAFVWAIHRRPVNSPHKWPVTRKMFPIHDIIVLHYNLSRRNRLTHGMCAISIRPLFDLWGDEWK